MNHSLTHELALIRLEQDNEWGGPVHDDQHEANDWKRFIEKQLTKAFFPTDPEHLGEAYRKHLLHTAALCIAAVESFDRKVALIYDVLGKSQDGTAPLGNQIS